MTEKLIVVIGDKEKFEKITEKFNTITPNTKILGKTKVLLIMSSTLSFIFKKIVDNSDKKNTLISIETTSASFRRIIEKNVGARGYKLLK